MEQRADRLRRLLSDPREIPLTLVNSLANFLRPELEAAIKSQQAGLLMLGSHAVIQIVAGRILRMKPREGTRHFLEEYVDGDRPDLRFSQVSDLIHSYRNVLAHQWFTASAHEWREDWKSPHGWIVDGSTTVLNPGLYGAQFLTCFAAGSPLYSLTDRVSRATLTRSMFSFIVDWLEVDRTDALRARVTQLDRVPDAELDHQAHELRDAVLRRFADAG